jgi:hypothetical protein
MSPFKVKQSVYREIEDFTFYIKREELAEKLKTLPLDPSMPPEPACASSFLITNDNKECQKDDTARLDPDFDAPGTNGRLSLCSCFAGRYVSCTFRPSGVSEREDVLPREAYSYGSWDSSFGHKPANTVRHVADTAADEGGVKKVEVREAKATEPDLMNSMEEISNWVFDRVNEVGPLTQGLIVIAGSTNTGKSQLAVNYISHLIQDKVKHSAKAKRRPHLITFEDPIENYWVESPDAAAKTGIDYTPREKDRDVNCLQEAIEAALRHTPTLFFVGETRNQGDWKHLIQFASTGHLCLTTSHAGSLTEAMGQLLHANQAESPAGRSEVARKILAIVHLRSEVVDLNSPETPRKLKVLLPAIWVRSDASTMRLMADGLIALLPFRSIKRFSETGCLGRTAAAEALWTLRKNRHLPVPSMIMNLARKWDLEGV